MLVEVLVMEKREKNRKIPLFSLEDQRFSSILAPQPPTRHGQTTKFLIKNIKTLHNPSQLYHHRCLDLIKLNFPHRLCAGFLPLSRRLHPPDALSKRSLGT
jgi:hypothetical protein